MPGPAQGLFLRDRHIVGDQAGDCLAVAALDTENMGAGAAQLEFSRWGWTLRPARASRRPEPGMSAAVGDGQVAGLVLRLPAGPGDVDGRSGRADRYRGGLGG